MSPPSPGTPDGESAVSPEDAVSSLAAGRTVAQVAALYGVSRGRVLDVAGLDGLRAHYAARGAPGRAEPSTDRGRRVSVLRVLGHPLKGWRLQDGYLKVKKARAVRRAIRARCRKAKCSEQPRGPG